MIENLLHEMMGEEAPVLTDDNRKEINATLQYILYLCCTERERSILRMRFEEQLNYRQISACTLISDERVRQIIVSCLKKINAYRDMLKCGIERYYQNQIIRLQERQRDEIARLNEIYGSNVSESAESECICPVWIEDMQFSARAYNGLRRAEIHSLAELTQSTTDEISRIRNLGEKTVAEIIDKVHSYGLKLLDEP
ncbi:MAG: DNA-directed RNA polymerase subunit alpha C-terminal domain-containing protein [Oscillospiraceae bacterium]